MPVGIPKPLPRSSAIVPLRFGGETIYVPASGDTQEIAAARRSAEEQEAASAGPSSEAPDLSLIARRSVLKAESCRFVAERRAAGPARYTEFGQHHGNLHARRKELPHCFLRVLMPDEPLPTDAVLESVAACYDNLARAAGLVERVPCGSDAGARHDALQLLAAAQSALRVVLADTWPAKPDDRDQSDAFGYLADATRYERVYIGRHMRLDDAADPGDAGGLADRIAAMEADLEGTEQRRRRIETNIKTVLHHARAIAGDPDGEHDRDWEKIAGKLAEIEDERALRDARLAHVLGPIAGGAPPGAAGIVSRVLPREAEELPADAARPREYSAEVARVRGFLRGGRVVLIGGERRDEAERRIREAFDLGDLEWISLSEHSSSAPVEPAVKRAETRLVLVLVKLAGHLHIDDTAAFCRAYGKPLVRLPAGYNPEQIAVQVQEQAMDRLG